MSLSATSTICVLGGSGFVGRHVCAALAARGLRLRVPTRDRDRAKHLTMLPTVDLLAADVHDPATLSRLLQGCDAVINLVGVLHGGRGNASFAAGHLAHVQLQEFIVVRGVAQREAAPAAVAQQDPKLRVPITPPSAKSSVLGERVAKTCPDASWSVIASDVRSDSRQRTSTPSVAQEW